MSKLWRQSGHSTSTGNGKHRVLRAGYSSLTFSIATPRTISLRASSGDSNRTNTLADTPVLSRHSSLYVNHPNTGKRNQYWPLAEKFIAPRTLPLVLLPARVARERPAAKAAAISPALDVHSFIRMTVRPWKGCRPKPCVRSMSDLSRRAKAARRASASTRVCGIGTRGSSWDE